MPRALRTRPRALTALGLAAAAVVATGCGTDARQEYADGWNGVCRDVASAMGAFRTDVSTAATTSPDAGDEAAEAGLRRDAVAGDLAVPARKLERALRDPLRRAAELDAPEEWRAWQAQAARDLRTRGAALAAGVRRLQDGDPDALPLLALGSVGPAATTAPAALRDRTPDCTVQR